MSQPLAVQDPAETQGYSIDWTAELGGETIVGSAWAATPASGGVTIAATAMTTTSATAHVSGLMLGQVYRLVNTVTTSAGRTLDDEFTIRAFPL